MRQCFCFRVTWLVFYFIHPNLKTLSYVTYCNCAQYILNSESQHKHHHTVTCDKKTSQDSYWAITAHISRHCLHHITSHGLVFGPDLISLTRFASRLSNTTSDDLICLLTWLKLVKSIVVLVLIHRAVLDKDACTPIEFIHIIIYLNSFNQHRQILPPKALLDI